MKNLREAIRAIIQDDALYKRKDLPGDVDDPSEEEHCDCGCEQCMGRSEDFVNPKYALYSLIGDAIEIYDSMESDNTDDESVDEIIMNIANEIRSLKG